jgi:hypothetical protein
MISSPQKKFKKANTFARCMLCLQQGDKKSESILLVFLRKQEQLEGFVAFMEGAIKFSYDFV